MSGAHPSEHRGVDTRKLIERTLCRDLKQYVDLHMSTVLFTMLKNRISLSVQGLISQRVGTSPNLELVLGDIQIAWIVLS